jgi:hypothetical protein
MENEKDDSSSEAHLKVQKLDGDSLCRPRIMQFCQNILILSRDPVPLICTAPLCCELIGFEEKKKTGSRGRARRGGGERPVWKIIKPSTLFLSVLEDSEICIAVVLCRSDSARIKLVINRAPYFFVVSKVKVR